MPHSNLVSSPNIDGITNYTFNSRHRLIQYKVLHKLNCLFPSVSPVCDKCHIDESSLAHLFWSAIFEQLPKAYSRDINLTVSGPPLDAQQRLLICPMHLGMVMVTKKLILLTWKSTTPPIFTHRLNKMLAVIQKERLCLHKLDKQNRSERIWGPFLAQCHIRDTSSHRL